MSASNHTILAPHGAQPHHSHLDATSDGDIQMDILAAEEHTDLPPVSQRKRTRSEPDSGSDTETAPVTTARKQRPQPAWLLTCKHAHVAATTAAPTAATGSLALGSHPPAPAISTSETASSTPVTLEALVAEIQSLRQQVSDLQHKIHILTHPTTTKETRSATHPPPPVPAQTWPKTTHPRCYAEVVQPSTPAPTAASKVTTPATPPAVASTTKPSVSATSNKRTRRVVVRASTPITLAPLKIRDTINTALNAANAPGYLLVRSVTINSKGNALLTMLEGGISEDVVKFSQHVRKALTSIGVTGTRVEPDSNWLKLLVHGVSVVDFGKEWGMEALRDEINRFNPKVQLASLPRCLLSEARREGKAYSSIVIAIRT
ncbi:hypothetical protein BJ508DRAFT_331233 [Ascobolus immersus RN42]|uniref:Uncharacterized protein n=1 Tax=Ascobolus immersus RN42 TaxID=1160509 RepID=A0A3N4HRD0_ASCIM|nr:hypothetical protein BJ508DRAFT_331233 [Ascobolus immersus RN42]